MLDVPAREGVGVAEAMAVTVPLRREDAEPVAVPAAVPVGEKSEDPEPVALRVAVPEPAADAVPQVLPVTRCPKRCP